MNFNTKEREALALQEARVRGFWFLMCEADGISPDSKFVVFSEKNPYHAEHNDAVRELFTMRKRFAKNASRRERHAVLTGMGLKRVRGALGGVYYE